MGQSEGCAGDRNEVFWLNVYLRRESSESRVRVRFHRVARFVVLRTLGVGPWSVECRIACDGCVAA